MKSGLTAKTVVLIFVAVLALYAALFFGIEHSRQSHGPWEVQFQNIAGSPPTLLVTQPHLNLRDVKIVIHGETLTNASGNVRFDQVKLPTPFGRVIYEDLTFLPGVVTFDLLGHEVELLPRALVVNKKLVPWQTGMTIDLWPTNKPAQPPQPPKAQRYKRSQ
jgi:hypothetical protein